MFESQENLVFLSEKNKQTFHLFQRKFKQLSEKYKDYYVNIPSFDHLGHKMVNSSILETDHYYFTGGVGDFCGGLLTHVTMLIDSSKDAKKVEENLDTLHRYIDLLLIHDNFAKSELSAIHVGKGGTAGYIGNCDEDFIRLRLEAQKTNPRNIRKKFVELVE